MKILLNGQVVDLEENIEAMRKALIQYETEQLKDIGCDALESDEMAHELYLPLTEDEILKTIKQLEIDESSNQLNLFPDEDKSAMFDESDLTSPFFN